MFSALDDAHSGSGAADETLGGAVDQARAVVVDLAGAEAVGDALALVPESEGVATQYFACLLPGYPGWTWAVTLAHASGESQVTVDEAVLLPGDAAITAPQWVPYRDRIQPGDLSPGDILPTDEDDARLVPTYLAGEDRPGDDDVHDVHDAQDPWAEDNEDQIRSVAERLGLGRRRVLSDLGREVAADRWYSGEQGPDSALAQSAHHDCWSCGFLVRLTGPLALNFGVCANEHANDDGRVVAFGHGCGAHSEAQLRRKQLPTPVPDPIFDTLTGGDLETF